MAIFWLAAALSTESIAFLGTAGLPGMSGNVGIVELLPLGEMRNFDPFLSKSIMP